MYPCHPRVRSLTRKRNRSPHPTGERCAFKRIKYIAVALSIILFKCCFLVHASSRIRGLNVVGIPYRLGSFHVTAGSSGKTVSKQNLPPTLKHQTLWQRAGAWIVKIARGNAQPGPLAIHHFLYWATAMDALWCLFLDDYTGFFQVVPVKQNLYSKLFYFARLRPRLLYAIGALLRALQICTPLQRILDPSIGVGAGINLCAMLASSRWVKPLVLGWATTKWIWAWLGGRPMSKAYVPITLSIREWDERTQPKKDDAP